MSFRYLEDFIIGERKESGWFDLTEEESVAFARRYDPQPMHIDREAAAHGPLQGLTASGWQTTAIVMRLIIEAQPFGSTPVLGLGVDEVRWPTPLRPGDSIRAEIEVLSTTPSKSKPEFGVMRIQITARNQRGEVVLKMIPNLWIPRRPKEP
ncbi:MAG TPA: MaoC family dehydratase [Bryobacteraceae bacterium]|nr:MaoC family dehydratase [Bryobacteraceae bacterium]